MHDIRDYEAIAMLGLPDNERDLLSKYLNELERGFTEFDGTDAQGVEPLVTVLDLRNVFRDDVAQKLFLRDEMLENAPEQYDGYFRVPGTL